MALDIRPPPGQGKPVPRLDPAPLGRGRSPGDGADGHAGIGRGRGGWSGMDTHPDRPDRRDGQVHCSDRWSTGPPKDPAGNPGRGRPRPGRPATEQERAGPHGGGQHGLRPSGEHWICQRLRPGGDAPPGTRDNGPSPGPGAGVGSQPPGPCEQRRTRLRHRTGDGGTGHGGYAAHRAEPMDPAVDLGRHPDASGVDGLDRMAGKVRGLHAEPGRRRRTAWRHRPGTTLRRGRKPGTVQRAEER